MSLLRIVLILGSIGVISVTAPASADDPQVAPFVAAASGEWPKTTELIKGTMKIRTERAPADPGLPFLVNEKRTTYAAEKTLGGKVAWTISSWRECTYHFDCAFSSARLEKIVRSQTWDHGFMVNKMESTHVSVRPATHFDQLEYEYHSMYYTTLSPPDAEERAVFSAEYSGTARRENPAATAGRALERGEFARLLLDPGASSNQWYAWQFAMRGPKGPIATVLGRSVDAKQSLTVGDPQREEPGFHLSCAGLFGGRRVEVGIRAPTERVVLEGWNGPLHAQTAALYATGCVEQSLDALEAMDFTPPPRALVQSLKEAIVPVIALVRSAPPLIRAFAMRVRPFVRLAPWPWLPGAVNGAIR